MAVLRWGNGVVLGTLFGLRREGRSLSWGHVEGRREALQQEGVSWGQVGQVP